MAWLLAFSVVVLMLGNRLRKVGIEQARANSYGSDAALRGERKSGTGTVINIIGGISLLGAILWRWL